MESRKFKDFHSGFSFIYLLDRCRRASGIILNVMQWAIPFNIPTLPPLYLRGPLIIPFIALRI
jgi:hypothetical protein